LDIFKSILYCSDTLSAGLDSNSILIRAACATAAYNIYLFSIFLSFFKTFDGPVKRLGRSKDHETSLANIATAN